MQNLYHRLLERALAAEKAYYEQDSPIMSDSAYDALVRKLMYIERLHPEWKDARSPTERVGGSPTNTFEKVPFPVKMLSLKNAFNEDDMKAFVQRTRPYTEDYVVQPKLDGLTLVLFYEDGLLVRAVTRGNGAVGEDVTLNAYNIPDIPKTLETLVEHTLMVRGEVVMYRTDFEALNNAQVAAGGAHYANPRNVAAGSIRQKNPEIAKMRKLHFIAYDIPGNKDTFESGMLETLQLLGFSVPVSNMANSTTLMDTIQWIKDNENKFPFAIDGAVIKCEMRNAAHTNLGENTHDPNYSIAYKFTPVSAVTTLLGITYQVGRTGIVTPVAELKPVEICGSTVSRATLHNEAYMEELGLSIGDEVSVFKAAEIIPEVDCVVVKSDNKPEKFITTCPVCGNALEKNGEYWVCKWPSCYGKLTAALRYFVGRECMDIRGLADAVLAMLIGTGKVRCFSDLYSLKKEDLLYPGLIADRKAELLYEEIQKSKEKPFDRVLCGLGIPRIASSTATTLANHFGDIDALLQASIEDISALDGLGQQSAEIIYNGLHSESTLKRIGGLRLRGLKFTAERRQLESNKLEGVSICITGTLLVPRDRWKEIILKHGGKFATSVTSKTTYLVAGTGGGEKRAKAQKLGVKIISEHELEEMLK